MEDFRSEDVWSKGQLELLREGLPRPAISLGAESPRRTGKLIFTTRALYLGSSLSVSNAGLDRQMRAFISRRSYASSRSCKASCFLPICTQVRASSVAPEFSRQVILLLLGVQILQHSPPLTMRVPGTGCCHDVFEHGISYRLRRLLSLDEKGGIVSRLQVDPHQVGMRRSKVRRGAPSFSISMPSCSLPESYSINPLSARIE